MSFIDKVRSCNRRDLTRFVPFVVDNEQMGWLTPERAQVLRSIPAVFVPLAGGAAVNPALATAKARSKAIGEITPQLVATGLFGKPRGELYAARNRWRAPETFRLDRALAPGFGVRAYGVHLNGFVKKRDELHLWIGTRAKDRDVEPGKLDNMVAGGQPAGLSLQKNLIKECQEEAHIGARRASEAVSVGAISYAFETPGGLKVDTLFCYDLEMKPGEKPKPSEEITRYELMPLAKVLRLIRTTERFKFNVNLVIIDFAVRHGVLTAKDEPEFEGMLAGLRESPQPIV